MPKQINVKLGFEADTKQAKAQIADLQKSLDNLMNSSIKNSTTTGFDAQISKAQQSVLKLKTAIDSSLNADTGRLDLSKFNQQLNNSGMSLTSLSKDMNNLGADGQKAFLNLANSIVTAQKPMVESNKLLDNMWTALKNTARWQLSSSILHGFVGSLQGAYGYAQDLNKSLNSIRIVSGQSVEQMAAFADQANKSAQALSTSTLAYTDAALIFYQQGLRGNEVTERVDTVLKLSNVTGESAENVSSYMTAIWNNFNDGSTSLEHYADVITALGAATASSSEEIANGMQQFAAVADTVGLSYDYAATALATVVAQTRQSESTVGNSFRTIFSRLQGLKLGETLEDGTDLNKYSKALNTIGVDIKDQNGDLKDMNTILDEIGAKWQSLAKDQQIALAQTVGGVRQYTNLVALFDNWDKFQENLKVANGSDGALQEQADIYAQSWEAAQKRVKAAWQALYQDLIDDKFFITILDGLANILKGVDSFIDSIGGLKGILSGLGVVITTVFNKQLTQGLQNAQQQFKVLNGTAKAESDAMAVWVRQTLDKQRPEGDVQDQTVESLTIDSTKQRLALTIELKDVYDQLSDSQKIFADNLLDSVQAQQQLTIEAKKTEDTQRKAAEDAMRQLRNSITASGADKELTHFMNGGEIPGVDKTFSEQIKNLSQLKKGTAEYNNAYQELFETMVIFSNGTEKQINLIERFIDAKLDATKASNNFKKAQEASDAEVEQFNQRLQELIEGHHNGYLSTEELTAALENEKKSLDKTKMSAEEYENKVKELEAQIQKLKQSNQGILGPNFAQSIVNGARTISQLTMGINSLKSAWDTAKNPDIKGWEKLGSVLTSLTFGVSSLTGVIGPKLKGFIDLVKKNNLNNYLMLDEAKIAKNNLALIENKLAKNMAQLASQGLTKQEIEETYATEIAAVAKQKEAIASGEAAAANFTLSEAINVVITKLKNLWAMIISNPIVAVFAATIGLVVAGLVAWSSAEKERAEYLKEHTKAINDAKESAIELTKSYDDLKNKLEELNNKKNSLRELEKGTTEWKVAVQQLNSEMLDLIKNYNLIEGKDFYFDENGAITLSEAGRKNVDTQAAEKVRTGQITSAAATFVETSSQKQNRNNIFENFSTSYKGNNAESYRELVSDDMIKLLGATNLENIDAVKEALQQGGMSEEAIQSFADLITSNKELQNNIQQLSTSMANNTNAQEAALKSDVYQKFDGISDMAADVVVDSIKAAYDRNYAQIQVGDAERQEFASAQGWSQDAEGQWVDASGNIKSITDEMVKGYLALNAAYDEAYGAFEKNIGNLEQRVRELQIQELTEKISSNAGENDQGEVSKWANELNEDELKIAAKLDIDYKDSLEDVKNKLHEALSENPVEIDTNGLSKKKAEELKDEFESLTKYIKENAKEIDGLDEHLQNCARESSVVARAILRFDDAIQDVTENYDRWNKALKTGSMQEAAKAANEMQEAYGNLLDIDASELSSDFLQNAKNLDLMKEAINGNEKAYQQLQETANQDILAHLDFAPESLDNFYSQLDNVKSLLDKQNFPDLEVGANLDTGNFLKSLTDMVNAAHMTETEATAYLANMGIDATVKKIPADTAEVQETETYWKPATYHVEPLDTMGGEQAPAGSYGQLVMDSGGEWISEPKTHTEQSSPSAFTLEVTSAHKSSGGKFKFQNASHGGGGQKSGKGGKKGGGKKGGGGGGSKKKDVKTPKEHVKKEDRYHDLKEQLDDVQKAYDKVNKSKDRAFGLSKLKYLDKEIDKLKEEDKLLKQYVKEIESYAKKDLADLMSLNIGAQFDDTGKLLNYEAVLKRIVDDQNAAIDKFNAAQEVYNKSAQSDSDKEILEAAQRELEAQEKVAKDREEKLKQYEDTYNLWQDQVWAELQKRWEIYDKNLEQVTLKAEIQLDFNEHDLELLEFYFDNLGDGVDKATDKIANLNKQMGIYEDNLDIYREGISGIFKNHGIDVDLDNMNPDQLLGQLRTAMTDDTFVSELTDEEGKQLQEFAKGLMENIGNIKDKLDEVHEVVSDTFDKWHENLQDAMHDYEKLNKLLDHNRKIIELTGKDYLKISDDMMRQMDQQAIKVAQDMTASSKQIAESLAQQAADAKATWEHYLAIGDETSAAYWEEYYKQVNEAAEDAMDEFRSNFENSMELVNQAFENSIDEMTKTFKDAFGDMGIDYILDRFDRQKELDELYLPEFKKFNELNKATKELDKSLQKTNNNIIKGKMNDLMGEINDKMVSGVKMSETEAEIIAKRVALLQAEDQLLAARQAKSAVRMTRDNEGNFSYTYTADQDAIGDAESAYSQQFSELLELERNASDELQSRWLQKYSEFSDRAAEIARKYYNSDREKYNKEMSDLLEEYNTFIDYYVDQQDMLFGEMARLRDNDWKDFERVYDLKLATEDDFITRMEDSILGRLVPSYQSAQDVQTQWEEASTTAISQINDAMDQWVQNTEESFAAAGETTDAYGQKVAGNIQDIGIKSDETKEKVSGMIGDMETGMKKVTDAAVEMDNQWGKSITDMINKNGGLIASINELLKKINQISKDTKDAITDIAKAQEDAFKSVAAASQAATGAVGGGPGSGGGDSGNSKTRKTKTKKTGTDDTDNDNNKAKKEWHYYTVARPDGSDDTLGSYSSDNDAKNAFSKYVAKQTKRGVYDLLKDGKRIASLSVTLSTQIIRADRAQSTKINYDTGKYGGPRKPFSAATGGYTGDWHSKEGRLAILHQKEIVLNEDDTKNLLKSVDIIRNMKDLFQTKVSMGNINYNVLAGAGAGELQQQVHIDASFPNVTDHNEIELALNNLVNSTTQYINRRRVK